MFGNYMNFGELVAPREFSNLVRIELIEKFVSAWLKANPNRENREEIACNTAESFVLGLGSYAHAEFFGDRVQFESTQRRREKLRAFANALGSLMMAAEKLDMLDLDAAIAAGISAAAPAAPDLPRYHRAIGALSSEQGRVNTGELIFRLLRKV